MSHLLDRRDAFIQIPQHIRLDPASAPIATPANMDLLGAYVLLYLDRDASWPSPTFYPAWLLPEKREALEAAGLIEPLPGDTYTIPGYDATRQKRHNIARKGADAVGHAPNGTFARTADRTAGSGVAGTRTADRTAGSGRGAPLVAPLQDTQTQTQTQTQTSETGRSSARIGQEDTQSLVSARETGEKDVHEERIEPTEPREATPQARSNPRAAWCRNLDSHRHAKAHSTRDDGFHCSICDRAVGPTPKAAPPEGLMPW
jgi:hypothetical protein